MKASTLFSKKQLNKIQGAIKDSEERTNGEIRLHIENYCKTSLLERAEEVFFSLQMDKTENRNGVLIYIAVLDKKVAIIGDEGIDKLTPEDYWNQEVNLLLNDFKSSEFLNGLINVINRIGNKLQTLFPIEENDINELSNEISIINN